MGSYRRHDGGAHGDAAGLSQLAHGVHLDEGDALPHRLLHQRLEEPGVGVLGHVDPFRTSVLQGPAGLFGSHDPGTRFQFFEHFGAPPLPRRRGRFIG